MTKTSRWRTRMIGWAIRTCQQCQRKHLARHQNFPSQFQRRWVICTTFTHTEHWFIPETFLGNFQQHRRVLVIIGCALSWRRWQRHKPTGKSSYCNHRGSKVSWKDRFLFLFFHDWCWLYIFYAFDPAAGITPRSWPSSTVWPSDTNLVYTDGSNKLRLTLQHPLVQRVIQDAINNFKASILFNDAFPDASISLTFARDAFLSAAKAHYPATQDIQHRLTHDVDYITQINRVVRIQF